MFSLFNKKENTSPEENTSNNTSSDLYRDVVQDIALLMMNLKITSQPILKFLNNDQGLLEGVYQEHLSDPGALALKRTSEDTYATVGGMHALGMGAYAVLMQKDFNKQIGNWDISELQRIASDIQKTDVYELALNKLGYSLTGNNKRVLDHIILTGLQSTKNHSGMKTLSDAALKTYMNVMFNAGVTLVLRQ